MESRLHVWPDIIKECGKKISYGMAVSEHLFTRRAVGCFSYAKKSGDQQDTMHRDMVENLPKSRIGPDRKADQNIRIDDSPHQRSFFQDAKSSS